MPEDLPTIGRRYGTDKVDEHSYLPHYEAHLQHLRGEEFTLLEVGVGGYHDQAGGGASVLMWRDYFPRARIIGLDLFDKSFLDGDRVRTFQGSQDDPEVLQRILDEEGRPTVIIDDGSHRPAHLRATFEILFPELTGDGIYVLEDLQTSYWPEFGGRRWRHAPGTSMSLVKSLVDGLNFEEIIGRKPTYTDAHVTAVHCYHNVVFLQKGDNVEGSNKESTNFERFRPGPAPLKTHKARWKRAASRAYVEARGAVSSVLRR